MLSFQQVIIINFTSELFRMLLLTTITTIPSLSTITTANHTSVVCTFTLTANLSLEHVL